MNAPTLHLLLLFPFVFSEVGPLGKKVGEYSPNEIIFQKIWDAWTIIIQETLRIAHEAAGKKWMMGRRLSHMRVFTISPAHYNYLHFRGNCHNEPTKTKYYHKVVIFQQNCRSMILFPLVHENWWTSGGFSWWVDGSSDNKQKAFKSLIVLDWLCYLENQSPMPAIFGICVIFDVHIVPFCSHQWPAS